MKIIIFYAKYGGGHLNAANSIKEYLTNMDENLDIDIIDCMEYVNKTVNNLTTAAYKEMAKKYPWAWGKIYDESQKAPIAHISTRANKLLAIKLLKLLKQKEPDLIISTHPFGSQMCAYLKMKNKVHFKIATILTDFAPHDQWLVGSNETNYYFVANDMIKNYIKGKKIKNPKIIVSGIPISNKFSQTYDKEQIFNELNLDKNIPTILFFGGGEYGLSKNATIDIFKNICEMDNIQIIAIAGKNKVVKQEFENIKGDKQNIVVLPFTNKVAELMSISKLVVSKPGGLTTSETLASNIPLVIINPIPGQEEENANYLTNKNVARWIKNPNDAKQIISELIDDEDLYNSLKQNIKDIAKPNSAKEICDILISELKEEEK